MSTGGESTLRVRELPDTDYSAWTKMVNASPQGSIYSLPAYLEVLCTATGGRFRVLGVEKAGALLGGIALYEEPHRLGRVVSNRLMLHYNGVVLAAHASSYPSERTARDVAVLSALEEALSTQQVLRLRLHNRSTLCDWRVFKERGWQVSPSYSYVVALDEPDVRFQRVERNLRRLINRCEREGFSYGEQPDFEAFYRLHAQVHRRKGAPLYLPEAAFRRYFEQLHELGLARLCHAHNPAGQIVASQLVLHSAHPITHTVSAAADAEQQKSGANAFLRWKAFTSLASSGYAGNDLTDAGLNPVTHFKSQLGGDLVTTWAISRTDSRLLRAWELQYRLRKLLRRRGSRT